MSNGTQEFGFVSGATEIAVDNAVERAGDYEGGYLELLADLYNNSPDIFENALHRLRKANL